MSDKIPLKWTHLKNIFNMSQIASDPTRVISSILSNEHLDKSSIKSLSFQNFIDL
jgi:hypothetical protein